MSISAMHFESDDDFLEGLEPTKEDEYESGDRPSYLSDDQKKYVIAHGIQFDVTNIVEKTDEHDGRKVPKWYVYVTLNTGHKNYFGLPDADDIHNGKAIITFPRGHDAEEDSRVTLFPKI